MNGTAKSAPRPVSRSPLFKGFCARLASGHVAAAPLSSAMNSRRLMIFPDQVIVITPSNRKSLKSDRWLSALGQKQTNRRGPKLGFVRFGPITDIDRWPQDVR